ncbi:DMT family transporter [Cellulomonas cellasea]|uniref:DME family drug/metabolite transporter n=1 Tax=Cellulomonas cellasea TaxID=43670 RepID=A0A7W4UEZ6_9CELL|nr:DMT family transporter [Cellulomonas cellasea]MBB2922936.1 DME family drug/metabolite transporter [Cellulomonas cellasea]
MAGVAGAPARRGRVLDGFALVVLGALLWGTGGVAGTVLARETDLPMLAVASYRLLVGGGALVVVLALTGRLGGVGRSRAVAVRVAATAVLAAVYQAFYFVAVGIASVSVPTLVALGASPVLVAAATVVLRRRRPAARVLVALGLALAGLVLLVGVPTGPGATAGALLALVSAAAFATMTLLNARPVPGLAPLPLTALSFTLGGLLLLPVAATLGGGLALPPAGSGPTGWLLLAFLGLVPTALAYGAYFTGLRTVPATTASVVALLEPLTGAVLAALLLGDRLGWPGLVGGALLGAAVVVLRPRP